MAEEPYVAVGRVAKTHGLNGEVSVVSDGGASLALLEGCVVWFVPPPREVRSARVLSTRPGPKGVLMSFDGVTSVDQAVSLRGCELLVAARDLPAGWMAEDDSDYLGFSVVDAVHGVLGRVEETIVTGANDVWVVQGEFGQVLIPVIDDVVLEVDDSKRTIRVELLPGLLEEDDS